MQGSNYGALLAEAPADWDRLPIVKLGDIHAGGTPSRDVPSYWGGNIFWLTPGELMALNDKYIDETRDRITRAGAASSAAVILPPNSVLVTTRATIGSIVINKVPLATNQGFKNIVPNSRTDSLYLYYLLGFITPELIRRASGSTFLVQRGTDTSVV